MILPENHLEFIQHHLPLFFIDNQGLVNFRCDIEQGLHCPSNCIYYSHGKGGLGCSFTIMANKDYTNATTDRLPEILL